MNSSVHLVLILSWVSTARLFFRNRLLYNSLPLISALAAPMHGVFRLCADIMHEILICHLFSLQAL